MNNVKVGFLNPTVIVLPSVRLTSIEYGDLIAASPITIELSY